MKYLYPPLQRDNGIMYNKAHHLIEFEYPIINSIFESRLSAVGLMLWGRGPLKVVNLFLLLCFDVPLE